MVNAVAKAVFIGAKTAGKSLAKTNVGKKVLEKAVTLGTQEANRLKDIKDFASFVDKIPNVNKDKLSLGWVEMLAAISGKANKGLTELIEGIKRTVGKNASVSFTKEASKQVKGASVVRVSINNGKKTFAKFGAFVDNTGENPVVKIGGSIPSAKTSAYAAADLNKLNSSSILGDISEGIDYKGTMVKAHLHLGKAAVVGVKGDTKAVGAIVDKVAGKEMHTEFKMKSGIMKFVENARKYLGIDQKPAILDELPGAKQSMYETLFPPKADHVANYNPIVEMVGHVTK